MSNRGKTSSTTSERTKKGENESTGDNGNDLRPGSAGFVGPSSQRKIKLHPRKSFAFKGLHLDTVLCVEIIYRVKVTFQVVISTRLRSITWKNTFERSNLFVVCNPLTSVPAPSPDGWMWYKFRFDTSFPHACAGCICLSLCCRPAVRSELHRI